jgi:phosphopantothenoylcysteine synthetase/decarboxylase
MYYLAKNKFNIKLKQLIIYILSYLASYYLIKDPNPFYYLFTFYLPMPNYFRAIFIIIFNTYIFNKYIIKLDTPKKIAQEEKKEEEKNDQKEINEPKKEDDDKNENTDNDNKNAIIKKGEEIKKEADDKDKEKDKSENKKEEFNKLFFLHYEIKYLLENKESLIWFFIYLLNIGFTSNFKTIIYFHQFITQK